MKIERTKLSENMIWESTDRFFGEAKVVKRSSDGDDDAERFNALETCARFARRWNFSAFAEFCAIFTGI